MPRSSSRCALARKPMLCITTTPQLGQRSCSRSHLSYVHHPLIQGQIRERRPRGALRRARRPLWSRLYCLWPLARIHHAQADRQGQDAADGWLHRGDGPRQAWHEAHGDGEQARRADGGAQVRPDCAWLRAGGCRRCQALPRGREGVGDVRVGQGAARRLPLLPPRAVHLAELRHARRLADATCVRGEKTPAQAINRPGRAAHPGRAQVGGRRAR